MNLFCATVRWSYIYNVHRRPLFFSVRSVFLNVSGAVWEFHCGFILSWVVGVHTDGELQACHFILTTTTSRLKLNCGTLFEKLSSCGEGISYSARNGRNFASPARLARSCYQSKNELKHVLGNPYYFSYKPATIHFTIKS